MGRRLDVAAERDDAIAERRGHLPAWGQGHESQAFTDCLDGHLGRLGGSLVSDGLHCIVDGSTDRGGQRMTVTDVDSEDDRPLG